MRLSERKLLNSSSGRGSEGLLVGEDGLLSRCEGELLSSRSMAPASLGSANGTPVITLEVRLRSTFVPYLPEL